MIKFTFGLIALLSTTLLSLCQAQSAEGQRGGKLLKMDSTAEFKGRTFAVIVGVSAYKKITPLSYADRDAILFLNFLTSAAGGNVPQENIKVYINDSATGAAVGIEAFKWLSNRSIQPGDRIFFYFAGHGDGDEMDNYYFLTSDADTTSGPRTYPLTGNIDIGNVKKYLSYYTAKAGAEVFLIIDACRTNPNTNQTDIERQKRFYNFYGNGRENLPAGFNVLYSTKKGSPAFESPLIGNGHGVFSYCLVQGLLGKADKYDGNNDGIVDLKELTIWLKKSVAKLSKEKLKQEQKPQYCCEEDEDRKIVLVNKNLMEQYENEENKASDVLSNLLMPNANLLAGRSTASLSNDPLLNDVYNRCMDAIKAEQYIGNNAAEYYLQQMKKNWPNEKLTEQATLQLITKLVTFAQAKIQLYLSGTDMSYAKGAGMTNVNGDYILLQRVSTISFAEAAAYLEKAIALLGKDDMLAEQLQPKLVFAKARSYFDRSPAIGLDAAIQLAETALKADSNAVHLYHLLAMLELEKNPTSKKAESYFLKAFQKESKWSKASVDLGYYYYQIKDFDKAKKYYKIGITGNKNYAAAYNNLAVALEREGKFDEAEKYYRLSIEKEPNDETARYNLCVFFNQRGLAFFDQKDFNSAIVNYKKAIATYDTKEIPYLNLGNVYLEQKEYSLAEKAYKKALELKPGYDRALYNLGILMFNSGNYTEAANYFNQCMQFTEKGSWIFNSAESFAKKIPAIAEKNKPVIPSPVDTTQPPLTVGKQYMSNRNYVEAERFLLLALTTQQGNCLVNTELGKLYIKTEKYSTAEKYLAPCVSSEPYNADAAVLLGTAMEKQSRLADAEKVFMTFYYRQRQNKIMLKCLIDFYQRQNKQNEAERFRKELQQMR